MREDHSHDPAFVSLVEEIVQGNESAFRDFFFLLYEDVYRFLYLYTRCRQTADDLTQETFINFWEARERIRPDASPRSYLFRIARNLAVNHHTRRRREDPVPSPDDEALLRYSQNPEEEYARRLAADEVLVALGYLPERSRAAFVLSRYQGLSNREIAHAMHISVQTVKNQISKALAILRLRLVDRR